LENKLYFVRADLCARKQSWMSKQRLTFSIGTQTSVHNLLRLYDEMAAYELAHLMKLDSGICIFGADESILSFVWSCRLVMKSTLRPEL